MLDWVYHDLDKDDMYAFESIKAHCLYHNPTGKKKVDLDKAPKRSYQLLVDWASGEMSWVTYSIIFQDDHVAIALHVKRSGLLNTPGWKN
jgi:hypothetical protein